MNSVAGEPLMDKGPAFFAGQAAMPDSVLDDIFSEQSLKLKNDKVTVVDGCEEVWMSELEDGNNPDQSAYLYYLPGADEYFVFKKAIDEEGKASLLLSGRPGSSSILFTENQIELIPPKDREFADQATRYDYINCIGRELGIYPSIGNLKRALASLKCSELKKFGMIQTALLCKNGSGYTTGCYTGMAKLIGCGYVHCGSGSRAVMTSPSNGSRLTSSRVTFRWTSVSGATQYYLFIGTRKGARNIYYGSQGRRTYKTVYNIPTSGSVIYVTLFTRIAGKWLYNQYSYTTAHAGKARMISPTPGSRLTSSRVTFRWTNAGASQYYLAVGTNTGVTNIYHGYQGTRTYKTVYNIPTNGSRIYVKLYSKIAGKWSYNLYSYNTGYHHGTGSVQLRFYGKCVKRYVVGAKVTMNGRYTYTSSKGLVTFSNLPAGRQKFTVSYAGGAGSAYITVISGKNIYHPYKLAWVNDCGSSVNSSVEVLSGKKSKTIEAILLESK